MSTGPATPASATRPEPAALFVVARRLIWWLEPEAAIRDRRRLIAQAMTIGTWQDVETVRTEFGDAAVRDVLVAPPSGVFDRRSWVYWHHRMDVLPIPPLPVRYP